MYYDIRQLERAGYEVREMSPWHYQVEQNGIICNIWPSKSKYMQEFGDGASIYEDVVEAVESIVGPAGIVETRRERGKRIADNLYKKYRVLRTEEWDEWRYELDVLVNYIHRVTKKAQEKRDAMDF